jgi:hypothetical protein
VHVVAVGDSDAGIAAALRARELDPSVDVSVVVADRYPNFSICGIPYHVSGDVPDWRRLAHCSMPSCRPLACGCSSTPQQAPSMSAWTRPFRAAPASTTATPSPSKSTSSATPITTSGPTKRSAIGLHKTRTAAACDPQAES